MIPAGAGQHTKIMGNLTDIGEEIAMVMPECQRVACVKNNNQGTSPAKIKQNFTMWFQARCKFETTAG